MRRPSPRRFTRSATSCRKSFAPRGLCPFPASLWRCPDRMWPHPPRGGQQGLVAVACAGPRAENRTERLNRGARPDGQSVCAPLGPTIPGLLHTILTTSGDWLLVLPGASRILRVKTHVPWSWEFSDARLRSRGLRVGRQLCAKSIVKDAIGHGCRRCRRNAS